jgi:Fe-S-cluster containining protein
MVKVGPAEITRLAAHLGLSEDDFIARYTRLRDDRRGLTLTERPDGACILLEGDRHCRVNAVKPDQCVGFPNTWNFPGFERECPAVKLRYHLRPLSPRLPRPAWLHPADTPS